MFQILDNFWLAVKKFASESVISRFQYKSFKKKSYSSKYSIFPYFMVFYNQNLDNLAVVFSTNLNKITVFRILFKLL